MNPNIPYSILLDSPKLWEELYRYSESLPEYSEAYGDYRQVMGRLEETLDRRLYLELERTFTALRTQENRGGLLFGLGLRRELLSALGAAPNG